MMSSRKSKNSQNTPISANDQMSVEENQRQTRHLLSDHDLSSLISSLEALLTKRESKTRLRRCSDQLLALTSVIVNVFVLIFGL